VIHSDRGRCLVRCFGPIVFFGLATSAFASATLDVLVNAAASFSAMIQQQLEMLQSNPSPVELAEKTIDYAEAKDLCQGSAGGGARTHEDCDGQRGEAPELDTFAAAFAVAGEDQEKVADQETLVLLKRFSRNPDIEKARVEFERAQKVEEQFHKDFDGVDFTNR
jgi:hypothetical protein